MFQSAVRSRALIDLESYFARVGYRGPRTPTAATLDAIHRAHVAAIPFENLDVLLGRGVELAPENVQAKLVGRRRGGYCFEHVTLFGAVLDALGFSFQVLGARVHVGSPFAIPPRTHALVRVELAEGAFLADPGFGGLGPRGTLPFVEGTLFDTGSDLKHRLLRRDDTWVLHGEGFGDLHAFTLDAFHPIDLEVANHYTASYPRSRFRSTLMVQRHIDGGRVSIRDGELTLRTPGEVRRTALADRRALYEALRAHFELDVPEILDTPMPGYA